MVNEPTHVGGCAVLDRCYAVTGSVHSGPQFCGFKAKATDANGRPCCLRHLHKQEGIAWYGDRYRYPEGTGGRWTFRNGEPRGEAPKSGPRNHRDEDGTCGWCGQPWPCAATDDRDPACVGRWPECHSGDYDPRCCRFPKSCSPTAPAARGES